METVFFVIKSVCYAFIIVVFTADAVKMIRNEEKCVKEWLLLAVSEAEKALGGGVGKLKLRTAFQSFVKTYPVFSKLVSFETFSYWVDDALDEMKKLIQTNEKAAEYISPAAEKEGDKNGE